MNTQANAMPESALRKRAATPVLITPARRFYWSVRREFWEYRFIYWAPILMGAVFLLGFMISLVRLPHQMREVSQFGWLRYRAAIATHYDFVAGLMMLTSIMISVFYCSDALHGERSDRSILFWKSLPVSDWTTVLAKASIPFVIVPLIACIVAIGAQCLMLPMASGVLLANGFSVARYWSELSVPQMWWLLVYHIFTAHAIWPAPVYAYLLLVSGWARRGVLLWAALPVVAIGGLEFVLFRTSHFMMLVASRLIGSAPAAANGPEIFPTNPMTHIVPVHFILSPGFWIGLVVTVAFLAGAVRLRRYRGPM